MFGVDGAGWLRVYRLDGTVLKTPQELAEENVALAEENARLRTMLARLQGQEGHGPGNA